MTAQPAFEPLLPHQLGLGPLFETMRDGIVVAEASQGAILLWNPAASRIFGYAKEEVLGKPIEMLMPQRMREMHHAGLSRFARTDHGPYIDSHMPVELPAVTKDGSEIAIELTLSKIEQVSGQYVLAVVRDITVRIHEEEELRQSHSRLQGQLQAERDRNRSL
ncbi:MAG TPA: PAS domain S-box protein [Actinomycetota bacterium]|nr:PAS domain S-box protein [Actinomycetota bacterium]